MLSTTSPSDLGAVDLPARIAVALGTAAPLSAARRRVLICGSGHGKVSTVCHDHA